ncbi:helix-turn-helix domain-containing protein [Streptomyces sp. WAC 01529]|uniref:MarR family transcriptional regulator n=1 Tax=Streptomyces sp. WAC 01529 TaxID=2203205 RepID=UPI001F0C2BBC|nr:helix-turn-helix domain-containing protein [Streptomyces sp. WAC 01529]
MYCVCAAGLFGEDLLQRGYRSDRLVLAHVARHPGTTTREVAQALGIPECRVTANLDRLAGDGLLTVASGQRSRSPALVSSPTRRRCYQAEVERMMRRAT